MAKQKSTLSFYQPVILGITFAWLLVGTIIAVVLSQKHNEHFVNISHEEGVNRLANRTYLDPVISISENRVYIPEIRAYMPLDNTTRNLKYKYDERGDSKKLSLSTNWLVGGWSKGSGEAPGCINLIKLSSTDTNDSQMQSVDPLSEPIGGMSHVSKHKGCKMHRYGSNPISSEDIEAAVRSLKSY